jgi:adenosine deaminase
MTYSKEFLRAIPKTDVHVHLDGSLRIPTLIDLAKSRGVELPSFEEAGLRELVFKDSYADLNDYLSGFQWTTAVLQDAEALERVAFELAEDNWNEGVRYIEVRFAPQLNMHDQLGFEGVIEAVDRGLRRARDQINKGLKENEPPFEYGIIVCAMRFFTKNFSQYFRKLFEAHPYSSSAEVARLASLELARAVVRFREKSDAQVVGFDLAGAEMGHPAALHQEAFDFVHRHFMNKTVHAGEAYGPESIFQAITKLHADRIGHGLRLFDGAAVQDPEISDPDAYVAELADFIANHRTTVEVCLTSNLQTSPDISDPKRHSLGEMLERNLSVTICTDNRLVSNTSVTQELELATSTFSISPKQLKNIIIYGFKRSFFPRSYGEKRQYVRQVIDYYDRIEQEHLG